MNRVRVKIVSTLDGLQLVNRRFRVRERTRCR